MSGAETLRLCGLAILSALCISVVRRVNAGFEMPMRVTAAVIFFSVTLGLAAPVISYAASLVADTPLVRWQGVLFGAIGVTFMTHATAELCRECGEGSIAGYVELAGKVEILLLCLPLVKELLGEVERLAL